MTDQEPGVPDTGAAPGGPDTSRTPRGADPHGVPVPMVRALLDGVAGWGIPFLIALPLAWTHEAAGGEAAIAMGFTWLLLLGPIGTFVAGLLIAGLGRRIDRRTDAFLVGLGAMALSVIPLFAIDAVVTVLHLRALALIVPLPMVVAYVIGFGARILVGWLASHLR